MVSGRFLVVAASFWASPSVPGNACVLNPLIVVADPNLAARPGHHGCVRLAGTNQSVLALIRVRVLRRGSRLLAARLGFAGLVEKSRKGLRSGG